MQYDGVTANPIWRTARHIENRLLAISQRMIIRLMRNFVG